MSINLTDPIFTDETKAREHLESIRWPDGPVCVHCGSVDKVYRLSGKSHRPGLIHCNNCNGSFTVTTGSVMESSHVPLNKWVLAFRLMASSKKGISAHQLHRTIAVTYKTAWFMCHRIREAMRDETPQPMGGEGEIVEADETYWGSKDKRPPKKGSRYRGRPGTGGKSKIVSLVHRGGKSRSFKVDDFKGETVKRILIENSLAGTRLMTDEGMPMFPVGSHFQSHETVLHTAEEYARGDVTTNTVEGFFSVFKRGMRGTYQHCGAQHLQRYLDEFDFRYSNRTALGVGDAERTRRAIKGAEGKRLTYRYPRSEEQARAGN